MRRIAYVALCNTRGGDLYLDKAVDSLVDGPGYYELVDFAFVEELKKILGCKSNKPLIMVTVGVLRAVEKYVFSNKLTIFQMAWIPVIQLYRVQKVTIHGIGWSLLLIIANRIAPWLMLKFQWSAFLVLLATNHGMGIV